MKATIIVGTALALLLSGAAATEINDTGTSLFTNNRATHIIKLRHAMNTTTAHDFILANHRAFQLSLTQPNLVTYRKRRLDQEESDTVEGYDTIFSATGFGPKLFLDSLTIDKHFTAVSGIFPDDRFIDYLHQQQNVEYVEINQVYKAQMLHPLQDYKMANNTRRSYMQKLDESNLYLKKKRNSNRLARAPNWGQARITKHAKGSLQEYLYDESAGEGVHVYVLDTGVNTGHIDFDARATTDVNFVATEDEQDQGGHGTHVAGKIAGNLYGVAKKATIHSVKILDKSGDGTTSGLIKGISHVINVATPGKAVINLSLSGPKSRIIDDILSKAINDHQIPIFVSAGNSASDACFFSPSSSPDVFSVGASDSNDDVPAYSNVGECTRIYAPGSDIESTWIGGPDSSKILDGTSMANPHVTGIAATLLSRKTFGSVQELYDEIVSIGTTDTLSFKWSKEQTPSKNLLAFIE